tara:strand:- start:1880 stop:2257 length:378 start_codon:yes stop_codon:yes gene_type:complete
VLELLLTFVFSLLVIGLLAWVLSRSKTSRYRPTRQQVVRLLQAVLEGSAQRNQWDLFIGYPLYHDPELEQIRLYCVALTQGDPETEPMASGIGGYLFDRAGRARLAKVLAELQQLVADEPFQRDF